MEGPTREGRGDKRTARWEVGGPALPRGALFAGGHWALAPRRQRQNKHKQQLGSYEGTWLSPQGWLGAALQAHESRQ